MGVYSAPKLGFEKSSELKKGSEKWNLLRDEVSKALEEYGCFEALLDGEIPKVKLYEKLKEVFNINLEKIIGDTQSVLVGSDSHNYELQAPLQQRLDIPYVLNDGAIENFSKNFWPNGESEFRLNYLTHRVIVGNGERYSLSFPLIPKEGYIIKVPEELVDEDHPLLYKPFDDSKLFPFFMSEGRRGVSATLEDFCGVSTNNPNLS
ncbi:hypothetical protein BC332_16892 [Capsicum chinense]|nr:hypothetical protein BC332_16892 [Capsicum chinense]